MAASTPATPHGLGRHRRRATRRAGRRAGLLGARPGHDRRARTSDPLRRGRHSHRRHREHASARARAEGRSRRSSSATGTGTMWPGWRESRSRSGGRACRCSSIPSSGGAAGSRSRALAPGDLPTTSRSALEGAGFEIVEEQQPSFLLDGSVLVTGEVDHTKRRSRPASPDTKRTFTADGSRTR